MHQVEQIFEGALKPAFSLSLMYTYFNFENLTALGYSNCFPSLAKSSLNLVLIFVNRIPAEG